jgi:transposase
MTHGAGPVRQATPSPYGTCIHYSSPASRRTGFRTCVGVLRLFRGIEAARAEAVSARAIEIGALSYASVASIFKHRLDQKASPQAADGTPLLHDNIRGSDYFH